MAYEFKKLGEVEALEEVPENANALIEVDGAIKRVPGSGLGGGGNKTAIVKISEDEESGDGSLIAVCENMTFAEAQEQLSALEPIQIVAVFSLDQEIYFARDTSLVFYQGDDESYILFGFSLAGEDYQFYWMADDSFEQDQKDV